MVHSFAWYCILYGALLAWAEIFWSRRTYRYLWAGGVASVFVLGFAL